MSVAVALSPAPILQFFNNSGQPNAGGSILTQVGGINYPTYQDAAGTIPLPNPIPLNSRGEISNASGQSCQLFLASSVNYVFIQYDSLGNQINEAQYIAPTGINYTAPFSGAVSRTVAAKLEESVSVLDFGADPTGVTDSTVAIMLADTAARATGAVLRFPEGTYLVSQLVINTGSHWRGDGRNETIILQKIGSNTDLLYCFNANANYGNPNPTNVVNGAVLEGLTINGNWNNGAGNTSGNGISWYGYKPIFRDVFVTNCAGHGIRSEGSYTSESLSTFTVEGEFSDVKIDTVGMHGWWNNGPDDSVFKNVIVVDAGMSVANTYDGFHIDAGSSARYIGVHAWARSLVPNMRYAGGVYGSGNQFSGGCAFENGYTASLGLVGAYDNSFDPSTQVFGAGNGTTILMSGATTRNILRGYVAGVRFGAPSTKGIVLGDNTGGLCENNDIDMYFYDQLLGAIEFTAYEYANKIKGFVLIYAAGYPTTVNNPANEDLVDLMVSNNGTLSKYNNVNQQTSLSIAPSSSATWTFPIPFSTGPLVAVSIESPSSGITVPLFASTVSNTSVTVENNNTSATVIAVIQARHPQLG